MMYERHDIDNVLYCVRRNSYDVLQAFIEQEKEDGAVAIRKGFNGWSICYSNKAPEKLNSIFFDGILPLTADGSRYTIDEVIQFLEGRHEQLYNQR